MDAPVTKHLVAALALVALSSAVQAWVVPRAVAPGLDAARFAQTAAAIQRQGLLSVVRQDREQPLYPLWLATVHAASQRLLGPRPDAWALAVKLAAAVPLVLSVVAIYWVAVPLFGARGALAGGVFYCLLPKIARLGADGISDPLHLFFFALAAGCIVAAIRNAGRGAATRDTEPPAPLRPATGWLAAGGILTGVAMLCRVESAVLLPALLLTLAIGQLTPVRRVAWRRAAAGGVVFAASAAAVLLPYAWMAGERTVPDTLGRLLARGQSRQATKLLPPPPAPPPLADGTPMLFSLKDPSRSLRHRGWWPAAHAVGTGLSEVYSYWIGVVALTGLLVIGRRKAAPVDWFVRAFCALYGLLVIAFVAREGYFEPRHLAPVVALTIGCAGFATVEAAGRVAALLPSAGAAGRWLAPAAVPLAVAMVALPCTGRLIKPVGHECVAHRLAGEWLAEQPVSAAVIDTRGWTPLYSGRPTAAYVDGPSAFAAEAVGFVVVERREVDARTPRGETLRQLLAAAGTLAASFAGPAEAINRDVLVYRWSPRAWRRVVHRGAGDARASASVRRSGSREL